MVMMSLMGVSYGFTAVLLSSFTKFNKNDLLKILCYEIIIRNNKHHDSNDNNDGYLVYIPTAKYYHDKKSMKSYGEQRRRARYEAKDKCHLLDNYFNIKNTYILELDDPNLTQQQIIDIISKASILYIDGGNTFYLQKYLIRFHFWDLIISYLQSNCIYIGASAGAIVFGRSIETSYWKGWDDPLCAGEDIDWNKDTLHGANLIPETSFFMHYDSLSHDDMLSSIE